MFAPLSILLHLFSSFLAKHKEIKDISRPLCSVRMVAQHLMNCNPLNYQYSKVVITTFDNRYELMRIVIIQIFQQVQISPRTTKNNLILPVSHLLMQCVFSGSNECWHRLSHYFYHNKTATSRLTTFPPPCCSNCANHEKAH